MARLRFKGFERGENIGAVSATVGGSTDTADAIATFQRPQAVSALPRIIGNVDRNDFTVDTTGLTNISAYDWREVGGSSISTESSLVRKYTTSATLSGSPITSVPVTTTIAPDTPTSGTLLLQQVNGVDWATVPYSNWSGSSFTISDPDADFFSTGCPAGITVSVISDTGGKWIECRVTADPSNTVYTSPPLFVHASTMMGNVMPKSHLIDEEAILKLVPHEEVTHIAETTGDWSNPATWNTGTVPKNGSFALISKDVTVTYDNAEANVRLDRIRVDGTLTWALDQSTEMLVETMVGTRGSTILMGSSGNRLPSQYQANIWISGEDYSANNTFFKTDIKNDNYEDTRGWGRGIVSIGTWRIWGAETTPWRFFDQIEVGDTTMTVKDGYDLPTNWNVGDELMLNSTMMNAYSTGASMQSIIDDEYVIIEAIDVPSKTITFYRKGTSTGNGALYRHGAPTNSPRLDIPAPVMKVGGRNISIQSEDTSAPYRRGHTAVMHMTGIMDFWDCQFIDMGRTVKERVTGSRVIKTQDDGSTVSRGTSGFSSAIDETGTYDSTLNIISRYPIHAHLLGFGRGSDTALAVNCYVEGVPGWGIVHHDCEFNIEGCVVHKHDGAGIVAEQGSEIGNWVGCMVATTTDDGVDYDHVSNPKTTEGVRAKTGDFAFSGTGFAFRGRAVRTTDNVATGCPNGYAFYHRLFSADSDMLVIPQNPASENIDYSNIKSTNNFINHPINHFNENYAFSCYRGMTVTKENPRQGHDINIHLKRFKAYGCQNGAQPEYVAKYLLEDFDIVSRGGGNGIDFGGNVMQIGVVNCRTERCADGVNFRGQDSASTKVGDNFNNTDRPRFWLIGHTGLDTNVSPDYSSFPDAPLTKLGPDVTLIDWDWDNTGYDKFQDPDETFPDKMGRYPTNSSASLTDLVTDSDGNKVDTLSSTEKFIIADYEDDIWATHDGTSSNMGDARGFARGRYNSNGKYLLNGGATRVYPIWMVSGDRVTARPNWVMKYFEFDFEPTNGVNLGSLTLAATDVTLANPNLTYTTNVDTAVTFNILTAANPSGAGGAGTYELWEDGVGSKVDTNRGKLTVNHLTGEVTYTPNRGLTGTDFGYIPIISENRVATCRVDFLIGSTGSGVTNPTTSDFSLSDAGSQTIRVTMGAQPDVDRRNILYVQYSTDSGSTWRRLDRGWHEGAEIDLTAESDGTAITAGSYNIRIRFRTDYDDTLSAASGDNPITVA